MRGARSDEGMVTAFVVMFAVALLFVAGLVLDGGRILAAHREAGNLAESAARAGAQAVSEDAVRNGDPIVIDQAAAVAAACEFLDRALRPCGGGTSASADGNVVTVTVEDSVDLLLLPGGPRSLRADGTACAAVGITGAEPSAQC